ncbi:MAG: HAMP domain-containing sensor histidine kinase, partial [Lachnospiraceae bacterium]|nr:HAMP domain-containing sensor histidine kinase [Lachnospiraceae bacterium]
VRTLTNASASKVELEMNHRMQEMERAAKYVNHYHGTGMTLEEMQTYFTTLYAPSETYSWQLVDAVVEDAGISREGFPAMNLCDKKADKFTYRSSSYPELAKIFCQARENTMGIIRHTSEFTDSSPLLEKSFALTATVRVRGEEGYEYQTLMHLIESDYINQMISNNNDVDTWNFFDYSNIIVDDDGNYVISNSYFQGTNFTDYIALYNEKFTNEDAKELCDKLKQENYSEVLYYQNNKGQDCAYSIVPVQNSNWHILSIVPLSSFHNTYDFTNDFSRFGLALAALFLVDIIVVLFINRKLRQMTKKAREANESKSRFLSSMSHDIRTPMNAIIGMTAIADKQLDAEVIDKEAVKESLKTIELSGNHLLTLINDVLDISKIESGKIALHIREFSIVDTVKKMVQMCRPQINQKNFDFKLQIQEIQHEWIEGDSLRINQIFVNILSNAIKYTEPGGRITVELREEAVPGKEDRAKYIYKVSDTGIGMTPEFLDTVFERFTRAVDTRVNAVQGTGLGM